ncbi:MAG: hypothetical protein HQ564_10405 [Candidatus Saganbacteria bacterium]|nr:hypothetical protein [Candidatus Saganbacteria bacterium]
MKKIMEEHMNKINQKSYAEPKLIHFLKNPAFGANCGTGPSAFDVGGCTTGTIADGLECIGGSGPDSESDMPDECTGGGSAGCNTGGNAVIICTVGNSPTWSA